MRLMRPGLATVLKTALLLTATLLALAGCAGGGSGAGAGYANGELSGGGAASPALRLARAARQAGDLGSAIKLYQSIVASPSVSPAIMVEYGDTLLEDGLLGDAIDAYRRVPAGSPAKVEALLGLTRAYVSLREPAKALRYAEEARRLAPRNERVLVDSGVVLDILGRHAEAQAAYRAALAIAPQDVGARNDLALSLAATGDYDAAVALMLPLVRSSAVTPRIRENLALIYGLMGDTSRSTELSRADLNPSEIRSNLMFYAAVRAHEKP